MKKVSPHAPWRKRILIPLWTIQLGLALVQLGWSLFLVAIAVHSRSDSGISPFQLRLYIPIAALSLVLTAVILFSIIKFARFRLTTTSYLKETGVTVVVGTVNLVLASVIGDFVKFLMVGFVVVSAGLGGNAWGVWKGVRRGGEGEMRRGRGGGDGGELGKVSTSMERSEGSR